MPKASLNVQCFVEKKVKSIFEGENQPKLLYVSEIRPDASAHPRVMHAHEDFVELILICSGSSEYLIHDKKVIIKPGDLLVYNAGVVHDEVSGPDMEDRQLLHCRRPGCICPVCARTRSFRMMRAMCFRPASISLICAACLK